MQERKYRAQSRAGNMASLENGNPASRGGTSLAKARSAIGRLRGHAAFWLNALSQPTIDLSLRTHAGLRTPIAAAGSSIRTSRRSRSRITRSCRR
jgi:hypothetical protein